MAVSSNVIIVLRIIEPVFWVHEPERFMLSRSRANIDLSFEKKGAEIPFLSTSPLLTILP
jgi:hypothetical protein